MRCAASSSATRGCARKRNEMSFEIFCLDGYRPCAFPPPDRWGEGPPRVALIAPYSRTGCGPPFRSGPCHLRIVEQREDARSTVIRSPRPAVLCLASVVRGVRFQRRCRTSKGCTHYHPQASKRNGGPHLGRSKLKKLSSRRAGPTGARVRGYPPYAISSQFTKAVRDIAERFEHRLFLSATPHNGHSNSFSALVRGMDTSLQLIMRP
jgi:hypothetical protein